MTYGAIAPGARPTMKFERWSARSFTSWLAALSHTKAFRGLSCFALLVSYPSRHEAGGDTVVARSAKKNVRASNSMSTGKLVTNAHSETSFANIALLVSSRMDAIKSPLVIHHRSQTTSPSAQHAV